MDTPETKIHDDCFEVKQTKWGTWNSFDLNGGKLVTSLTESNCIEATRFYLKRRQESANEKVKLYDGTVGGKL